MTVERPLRMDSRSVWAREANSCVHQPSPDRSTEALPGPLSRRWFLKFEEARCSPRVLTTPHPPVPLLPPVRDTFVECNKRVKESMHHSLHDASLNFVVHDGDREAQRGFHDGKSRGNVIDIDLM